MNKRIRHINGKTAGVTRNRTRNGFENEMLYVSDDSVLFDTIGEYMKGRLDMEDVNSDPALSTTSETVMEMISDYNKNISGNKGNEKFIRESFSGYEPADKISGEIKFIKQEIDDKNLNLITSEWVKEWHEKKQKTGVSDPKSEEIRNFITDAINAPVGEPVKLVNNPGKKSYGRSLFLRYVSLSAAALIGTFFLIRTLLPSSNPEKLFSSFYRPFDAISPVTRSISNNNTDNYSSAIASYKTGDYQSAAAGFAAELEKDPSVESARFFLGLSQLARQNYDQTIGLLSGIANVPGEYAKEARWYLGLSYLKTGNKQKAAECFKYLAKTDGFYRERSEKILRRLK